MKHMDIYEEALANRTTPAKLLVAELNKAINESKWQDGFTLFDLYVFLVFTQDSGLNFKKENVSVRRSVENDGVKFGNSFQDLLEIGERLLKFRFIKFL